MKLVRGWWMPESDTHFEAYFNAMDTRDYQKILRETAISRARNWRWAIDIGAHVGLWTRPLSEVFQFVEAFEPDPNNALMFMRNTLSNTKLHTVALGGTEGEAKLVTPKDNTGMAHLVGGKGVPIRTLDSYNFNSVDFIKIDCEGYEYPVVLGATETLKNNNPVVVVEQKPHPYEWEVNAAKDYLETLGYEVVGNVNHDWIMRKP